MLLTLIFCLSLIAVPFAVFPALLWARARLAPAPFQAAAVTPSVDLVICAHNEAGVIGERIENALALDYPPGLLTIWLASDGSTDDTVARAQQAAADSPQRLRVLNLPRTGKAGALTAAVSAGSSAVIAFSDANSQWQRDALRALVAPLHDPSVGGVAGDQRYSLPDPTAGQEASGERGYWSFDRMLKRWQSQAGNTTSATGAIYCIRRELFEPPPADATDDFMVSTGVIAAGRRLAFTPDAVAVEPPAASTGLEFRRKVRIISRGLRGVAYRRALMNPFRTGLYGVQLFVHKLWRRLVWLPLLVLILCSPFVVAAGGLAGLIGSATLTFVLLALLGILFTPLRRYRLIAVPAYVAVVNAACLVATYNLLAGRRISRWHLPRTQDSRSHDTRTIESR
ncbi:MAG: glycosyltransferase family 2 protein [Pseudomonadales bacterium]